MVAGSLTYDTKMDTKGFQKGINDITNTTKKGGNTIKNIVAGLGITKLISNALSVINSSIDGAVKRVDTLNNFPKVMENLGIKSEKSEKAIKKISDGLKGLPTTLNDGALAVQRFTSVNNDVEKSTDYFLALNNAILAGGASTELQASAIEQLSQAYSKGKPDMMEWRTLLMAMPAQLKQVASALGYINTDELYEGLKDGKISMDDFMQAIVRLNEDGTGEFLSFEKQAKNAVGGIGTSVTNAKTAVTRGVARIIDEIDKALKEAGFGGLGQVISNIGKAAESALEGVANFVSGLIKVLKDVFDWFSKNQTVARVLAAAISGVVSALIAYKTALIVIKAINFVSSIIDTVSAFISLIPAIKSASDAMTLLSMVIKANPFAILIAAIAAVATAFLVFNQTTNKTVQELRKVTSSAEEQRKSWEDLKEARNKALDSSSSEIVVTEKLADELRKITDENGKVKDGYENRAKYILGELNKALGTEYKLNGNIIQNYKDLKENIDKLIATKKAEAVLDAYKEEYATALKKQGEAVQTLIDLEKQLDDVRNMSADGIYQEQAKKQAIEAITEGIKKQTDLIGEYGYTVEKYEKLTSASVSGSVDEINNALDDMAVSYDEAKRKVNTSLNEQIKNQSDYVKRLNTEWSKAKNSNDKYQEQILKTQLDAQKESLKNLAKTLAKQTSTVDDLAPEQVEAWKELANDSEEVYTEALKQVPIETAKKIQEATGVVTSDKDLAKATGQEGKDATTAFKTNFNIKEPTNSEVKKTASSLNSNVSIQNASGKVAQRGTSLFKGSFGLAGTVADQLKSTASIIKANNTVPNAGGTIAEKLKSRIDGIVKAYNWGSDMTTQYAKGMKSWSAWDALTKAASGVAEVVRNFLHFSEPDIGPLSDFHTYMPDMIDMMVKGINDNKYKVTKALTGLTGDMEQKMRNAVNLEVGNMNTSATVRSNNMYNSVIQLNASFDGTVEMDGQEAGRIITPYVTKTIKAGGAY